MIDITKQIKHLDSQEEIQKETFRLIQENHETYILNMKENEKLTREINRLEFQIKIQEIRSHIPKKQIYFGKVKTE
jgi:hypothetical protein